MYFSCNKSVKKKYTGTAGMETKPQNRK